MLGLLSKQIVCCENNLSRLREREGANVLLFIQQTWPSSVFPAGLLLLAQLA